MGQQKNRTKLYMACVSRFDVPAFGHLKIGG